MTSDMERQLKQKEEQRSRFIQALEAMTEWTSSNEDAITYEPFMFKFGQVCQRVLELLSGFCAGFSMFLILSVYTTGTGSDYGNFVQAYSMHYVVTQKVFIATSLAGVLLSLIPFAHEAGLSRRKEVKGTKGRSGSGDDLNGENAGFMKGIDRFLEQQGLQPFRRLGSIQLWAFIGCLIASIITTSIEQGRTAEQIRSLPTSLVSKLHISIIIRGVLHVIAWLAIMINPLPIGGGAGGVLLTVPSEAAGRNSAGVSAPK